MAKVKVHELAKELNIQSKEILQYLSEQNIEVKSHMSSIEDDVIKVVKKKFAKSEPVKEEKAAPKAAEPYLKKAITKDLDLRRIAEMVKTRIEIFQTSRHQGSKNERSCR